MGATRSEEVFRQLANDIVTGRLHPGQKLEEKVIAQQFSVSRTPVREALRQLTGTGLVEVRPRKGVTVIRIDVHQLADMFDTFGELEALCAKLSTQRMSTLERKRLEMLNGEARKAVERNDDRTYSDLNEQLHELIYQGTHSASLRRVTGDFRRRLAPFRAQHFFKLGERMRSSFREHEELVGAILAGDAEGAFRAMRDHVARSSLHVISYFTESDQSPLSPSAEGSAAPLAVRKPAAAV